MSTKLSLAHIKKGALAIGRAVILIGLCFVILRPFIYKVLLAFMSQSDLKDQTVLLIPTAFNDEFWKLAYKSMDVGGLLFSTLGITLLVALLQTASCASVGYGLARFKFRFKSFLFVMVIVVMIIPPQVYSLAQYLGFVMMKVGSTTINLGNTVIPLVLLSATGLGLKEGLYIYLCRSFFMALPKELENAAAVDGAGPFQTFFRVMLPSARSVLVTVFLFAFSWQWTDLSYFKMYFTKTVTFAQAIDIILIRNGPEPDFLVTSIVKNAACLILMIPLFLLYVICQKTLVKSIARSGLAN